MPTNPFAFPLTMEAIARLPGASTGSNHLSQLRSVFGDQAAVDAALRAGDPVLYDFTAVRKAGGDAMLSFGLTAIHPGTVGAEYHMTRGHFHAEASDGDELYLGVAGRGLLLLLSRTGEFRTVEITPGVLLYTPLGWAHRTVNTGSEDLLFLSAWPEATRYDYEEITRRGGFPQRVMCEGGQVILVENPNYRA
jgi:glucose-6-phosphate isomerase